MEPERQLPTNDKKVASEYRGLGTLLHAVRYTQHLLSIIAEVLILLSFAMSGMDVSLGGLMATVPILKVLWAGMFALGIDTAFVLSWVRVQRSAANRRWLTFTWNILLALAMSAILFQPIAVQLLQQSLDIDFVEALSRLGIDIVTLTYARSAVAVLLGAILAMTNVESEMTDRPMSTSPKRKIVLLERLLNQVAPIVGEETLPTPITVHEEQLAPCVEALPELSDIADQITEPLPIVNAPAQPESPRYDTPEQRAQKVSELDIMDLSASERVAKVLELFPNLSDRELAKLSNVASATAKKYRQQFEQVTSQNSL